MMIVAIEEQHVEAVGATEYFGSVQSGESRADDDDPAHVFRGV
jgi:hypothetical protein